jgi:hypothetical protein
MNYSLALEFDTAVVHSLEWGISVYKNILPRGDCVIFYGIR